jgi:hypothetical protein
VCVFAHDRNGQRWMQGRSTAAATLLVVFQYDLITLYLWTRHGRNQGFLP